MRSRSGNMSCMVGDFATAIERRWLCMNKTLTIPDGHVIYEYDRKAQSQSPSILFPQAPIKSSLHQCLRPAVQLDVGLLPDIVDLFLESLVTPIFLVSPVTSLLLGLTNVENS